MRLDYFCIVVNSESSLCTATLLKHLTISKINAMCCTGQVHTLKQTALIVRLTMIGARTAGHWQMASAFTTGLRQGMGIFLTPSNLTPRG
jgi:hypothetical protein